MLMRACGLDCSVLHGRIFSFSLQNSSVRIGSLSTVPRLEAESLSIQCNIL
jgi:hypothetical protein